MPNKQRTKEEKCLGLFWIILFKLTASHYKTNLHTRHEWNITAYNVRAVNWIVKVASHYCYHPKGIYANYNSLYLTLIEKTIKIWFNQDIWNIVQCKTWIMACGMFCVANRIVFPHAFLLAKIPSTTFK